MRGRPLWMPPNSIFQLSSAEMKVHRREGGMLPFCEGDPLWYFCSDAIDLVGEFAVQRMAQLADPQLGALEGSLGRLAPDHLLLSSPGAAAVAADLSRTHSSVFEFTAKKNKVVGPQSGRGNRNEKKKPPQCVHWAEVDLVVF